MWEEARGLYPSHQIPELDQSHHAESLASKVSSKLQSPSSSAPTQGKALWAAADTPLESPGGHAVKWPCSTQRQWLPGLGRPDQHCHHVLVTQETTESTPNVLCLLPFKLWYLLENQCSVTASTSDICKCGISERQHQWKLP